MCSKRDLLWNHLLHCFLPLCNLATFKLPGLYRFLLFISCLLIYMLNYLIFLCRPMAHAYACLINIFGNGAQSRVARFSKPKYGRFFSTRNSLSLSSTSSQCPVQCSPVCPTELVNPHTLCLKTGLGNLMINRLNHNPKVKRSRDVVARKTSNISRKCHSVVEINLSFRTSRSLERMDFWPEFPQQPFLRMLSENMPKAHLSCCQSATILLFIRNCGRWTRRWR